VSILSFFKRTPKPARPHIAEVIPLAKLPRVHFLNAVDRAIRANNLDADRTAIATRAAADLWARHAVRARGYESARLVEQIAVDYCADLARFQLDQRVVGWSSWRPRPWHRNDGPDAAA